MSVPTDPLSSTAGDSTSGNNNDTSNTSSYIDYPALTAPTFSAPAHANRLVLSTNLPSDPAPLDLSTPLSRVLFDVQEIDSHLDTLTTSHALPLVSHAFLHRDASRRLLDHVEDQVRALTESYERLEREIRGRYANAETVRVAAERMLVTLRLGRGVQRCVNLGRQVEGMIGEVEGRKGGGGGGAAAGATGDCRALVPVAHALLSLRGLFAANGKGEEGEGLGRVAVCNTLRAEIVGPAERTAVDRAKQVVGGFSMSSLLASSSAGGQGGGGQQQQQQQSQQGLGGGGGGGGQTYAQTEDMKTRATSALQTLYLLSPTKKGMTLATFEPTLLIQALQNYLNTALTSSVAALARALATLPTLDRTLLEISARCQNIAALESLLSTIKPPHHPLLPSSSASNPTTNHSQQPPNETLLDPLLRHLDTSSLPSYFWRSMAGQLSSRVQDILARGGVSARTLRTNRDRVRDSLRECVDRGTRIPSGSVGILLAKGSSGGGGRTGAGAGKVGNWEREAAVMVGAVVGPLMQR
ncbi:putative Golgi transport complex component Cog5 [Hortaea werneckii]|uniref:Conserved oligomeric Golgi complex subunit 5 n=2 Tax=Hortaea werneckii TaxID=91943 RepID=A0A3M7I508_HORWE|nr:putative Golgi transport complex component Cog5 [Hortaea werneckii]OTA39902.1 hypothetical protein BTJ68_00019 [Hortaea werneckii EXF-2000]KAI6808320.1 putative Golgi transport complex component Cog5 [Hortaea werneckii]KAI6908453.1 putative Golgi transport complex component Cog5 [Hortaea werneckii]KAI6925254.1 putative Golgi transport complex component Cog5 [Hortaea werneckii]